MKRRRNRTPWSQAELRILDRCIRGVEEGRYETVADAARTFLRESERLRPSAGVPSEFPSRKYLTVHSLIGKRLKPIGVGRANSFWSPPEVRVLNRYVGALRSSRYRTVPEAARACRVELDRTWRTVAAGPSRMVRRTQHAVEMKLTALARAAGLASLRRHWSAAEQQVGRRYARALAEGRFQDVWLAASACIKELQALRPGRAMRGAEPGRTGLAVRDRLSRWAHKLGWTWESARWLPDERRILDRHVEELLRGRYASVRAAARNSRRELERLRVGLASGATDSRFVRRRRSLKQLTRYIVSRAAEQGYRARPELSPWEQRIVRRYVAELVDGQWRDATLAARSCLKHLQETRELSPKRRLNPGLRTMTGVRAHITQLAHSMHRPWPRSFWTAEELKLCRAWLRWLDRHRRGMRQPVTTAAEGMQEELAQVRCHRSIIACRQALRKQHLVRLGLA